MSAVVARVNGTEITENELNEMVAAYQQQTRIPEVSEDMRKMLLENLVENALLREEAKVRNLEVTDEILNAQLNAFYQQYGGEENLKEMLTKQNIDINEIIANIKADLLGQLAAKDELDNKMNVTDEDLNAFYEANKENIKTQESFRASHILFKTEDEGAKEKAEKVLEEIKAGGDFEALAKEHSACPSSARGGDLNNFGKGQMVPEFEQAVVSMDVDAVSDLVETQFGFHIIKKTGHTEGKQLSFDEAKAQIQDVVSKEKGHLIIKEMIEGLREKFDVEYVG